MIYRLNYSPSAQAVYDAMPAADRKALTLALDHACCNPSEHTEPYDDEAGDVVRMVVTDHAIAVLRVGPTLKAIMVLRITHLG
jgi:hypothetical protein